MRRAVLLTVSLLAVLCAPVMRTPDAEAVIPAPSQINPTWEWSSPGWSRSSSPVVANVIGDGTPEIVLGDHAGRVRVINPANGAVLRDWSVNVGGATPAIDSSPAVGNLDNSGGPEIVVGLGSTFVPNQHGGVAILRNDGSLRCHYATRDYGAVWGDSPIPDGRPDPVFSTPSLGYVDDDPYLDVVFGGFDLHIHAIDRNCNPIIGFPYNVEDSTWSSPALFDVDGDGRHEIFIGSDQFAGGAIDWSGGEFRALDVRAGGVVELWRRRTNDVIHSSPAIGDIDGDGKAEVVVGGGNYYNRSDGRKVFAWNAEDGSDVPGWGGGKSTGGAVFSSPALGDLNNDGRLDVVVGSRDGALWAWNGNGSLLFWRDRIANCCVPANEIDASPIIADLDGDGDQDVAVGTSVAFHISSGNNGVPIMSAPQFGYSHGASAAFVDLGATKMLVTASFITSPKSYRVAGYQVQSNAAPAWPMFQRDQHRTSAPLSGGNPLPLGYCRGSANPASNPQPSSARGYWVLGRDGSVHSHGLPYHGNLRDRGVTTPASAMAARRDGTGYWIVDDAGRVHAFGSAEFHGDMRGLPLNGRILALEPTPSGNGYWLLGADGGIFSFGDAAFRGSTGGLRLNAPIVSMKATTSGNGYWLLGADGGIFSYGDAAFYGSTGGMRLNAPVISMAVDPLGRGYWLLGGDGGVFTFGSQLQFHGSVPGIGYCYAAPTTQIRPAADGRGYWLLGNSGWVHSFGSAEWKGTSQFPGTAIDLAVVYP